MIVPRPYQDDAIQAPFQYWASGKTGNPVIALPTGTGKSVVIADLCHRILNQWPGTRIIVATHVSELVEQNAAEMLGIWPTAPVGIFSAGLGSKECLQSIIFASIQSLVNALPAFGMRHVMIVDEAHLVSPKAETQYQKAIEWFKAINCNFRVIGTTATPYRTGQGPIAMVGNMFTDVCYDGCSLDKFNWFIEEGFILPLIPKPTATELDVSSVSISNGDFSKNQLQSAVDKDDVTFRCCSEAIFYGQDRRSWIVFASGIEHAEHVADCLRTLGVNANVVHSKMSKETRKERITSFKNGTLRCLVNNGVLTTGFNHKGLDMIVMLRPTTSAGLWVQMLGRGTRPDFAPGYDQGTKEGRIAAIKGSKKQNCLVLDFAGNTKRLGPINDPVLPKTRKGGSAGPAPIKICPQCGVYLHASAMVCEYCGLKFERQEKITANASTQELIRSSAPQYEEFDVQRVLYTKMTRAGKAPALKVSYFCGLNYHKELIFLEEKGSFARRKAREWWRQRSTDEPPNTVEEALQRQQYLRVPKSIRIHVNAKYPEIVEYVW